MPNITRFTFLKLTKEKLTENDFLYLITFLFASILNNISEYRLNNIAYYNSLIVGSIVWYFLFFNTFGIRLKKIQFSLSWLLCSLIFVHVNIVFSYLPILSFIIYHLVRVQFWIKYKREFIPLEYTGAKFWKFHCISEGIKSTKIDQKQMTYLIIYGLLLFSILFFVNILS